MPSNLTFKDSIETSTPFILTPAQNDNIDIILDEQVVFIKDGEVQQFLFHWVGQPN